MIIVHVLVLVLDYDSTSWIVFHATNPYQTLDLIVVLPPIIINSNKSPHRQSQPRSHLCILNPTRCSSRHPTYFDVVVKDARVPLYMDEFLQLDAQAFDLLFMDAESGPRLMSFGLRAFQDYFLNDFVASSKPFDDLVAVDQAWKLGETVLSCQNAMLQALDAIEQQAMYDEVDLPKRQAAADAAAQKILEAKAHDENRKEAVGKWLRGEVDRLVSKSRDLRAKAASASEKAGCALYKVLGLLESHGYSDEFSQKLELWRQLDASQKAAYDVVNAPKDTTTFQETLADQCIGATSVRDTLLESTQVDGPSTQVDAVEASMQDDADIAMASQPDAELVLPDEADTLLHDPYGDVEEGDLEKDAEEGGGQDSNKAHTGEGGGQNDSHVAHTGEGGGQDSSKAHTGEGGGQDSSKAHTGEGGGQNDSTQSVPAGNSGAQVTVRKDHAGLYEHLEKLALDDVNADVHSETGSVELLNDDAFLEAELARMVLKAHTRTNTIY